MKKNNSFSLPFKAQLIAKGKIISEVDKKQAMEKLRSGFDGKKEAAVTDEKKIDNLYRQIGKLQVENDFLKQAVYPGTAS